MQFLLKFYKHGVAQSIKQQGVINNAKRKW